MGNEAVKRGSTPEALENAKKKALFQRLSWSGLLDEIKEDVGPISIGGAGETFSTNSTGWEHYVNVWQDLGQNNSHRKSDVLYILLRRQYGDKRFKRLLIKYEDDGYVCINGEKEERFRLFEEGNLNPAAVESLKRNINWPSLQR